MINQDPYQSKDELYMARAIQLARRGLNSTSPNPRVGCVIVNNQKIVGEGWHSVTGGEHAEVIALDQAGQFAKGASLYVNLEPCAHTGKTPPCVEAIVASGISRVVVGCIDPNPEVRGKGISYLAERKIECVTDVLERQSRELNLGFISRMEKKRPWVRLKIAAGLDGKTALENGESQWITSLASRKDSHHYRARSCAILTGVGTIVDDDPRLNVRHVETNRQPKKIIVDSHLRTPLSASLLKYGDVVIATASADSERIRVFTEKGIRVWTLPNSEGRVDLDALLTELAADEINEVLVEAGVNLHSALFNARLVNEMIVYYAPKFLGSRGRSMLHIDGLEDMQDVPERSVIDIRKFGPDLRVTIRF